MVMLSSSHLLLSLARLHMPQNQERW